MTVGMQEHILGHVRRVCMSPILYLVILPYSYKTYNSVEGSERVCNGILDRKKEIIAARAGAEVDPWPTPYWGHA